MAPDRIDNALRAFWRGRTTPLARLIGERPGEFGVCSMLMALLMRDEAKHISSRPNGRVLRDPLRRMVWLVLSSMMSDRLLRLVPHALLSILRLRSEIN